MGLAQGCHCWQRVEDVAHGSESDYEQAKLGLRLQTLIFSQGPERWRQLQTPDQPVENHVLLLYLDAQAGGLERERCGESGTKFVQPDEILGGGNDGRGSQIAGLSD
jgi:hypothetical protein